MAMPEYQERIAYLREQKKQFNAEKREIMGYMDYDDHGLILPPANKRKVVEAISGSGMPITDVLLNDFSPIPNHSNGSFYGSLGQGFNFKEFLLAHPPFVDPMSGLLGAYMCNFGSYRKGNHPDLPLPEDLTALQKKYQLVTGVFGGQHFCHDLTIGLELGWDGMLEKIARCRASNCKEHEDFYDGLRMVAEGIMGWIAHNAAHARELALHSEDEAIRDHLDHMADMNEKLVHAKPDTFEEACQWILWVQMAARSYNGSGALGRLDTILWRYYQNDKEFGILSDERAVFLLCCLLLRDTGYAMLGGYDAEGNDTTNQLSYLVLEAVHQLKLPSNIGVCVGAGIDRELLRRSVEYQFEDQNGNPRFVGMETLVRDFVQNGGVSLEEARARANAGCHWLAIPGREYSLMDSVKINFAVLLDLALRECAYEYGEPTMAQLLAHYQRHLRKSVETLAAGFTFHYENQQFNMPELVLDLFCHGTVEKGVDASAGGVEHYLWCVDGAALAVVADSLAAIELRILRERRYTFAQLVSYLDADWQGAEAEKARAFFLKCPRYGQGDTRADAFAMQLSRMFTMEVKRARIPKYEHEMIPGLFSWANTLTMGQTLGATPNGRRRGTPISHGANPNPGFRKDGAASALSSAIASVQCAYGNTAPMQLELEPSLGAEEGGVELVMALIEDHFAKGGTMINLNVLNAQKLRKANEDPSRYPDLVVRVTGFSAYFANLSPAFRQLVVDRVLDKRIS